MAPLSRLRGAEGLGELYERCHRQKHAHELIERPEPSQILTADRFMEFMLLDPVARAIAAAPADDEPVTDEDRQRFHNGQAWLRERGG